MVSMRMRPRFEVEAQVEPDEVYARLRRYFNGGPGEGHPLAIRGHHVEIKIPRRDHHFWSPQLNLEVHPQGEGARIEALFSPRPDIWTLFIALYAVAGFGTFLGGIFGSSQMILDQPPVGFWGVPASLLGAGVVFGASLFGQQLAQEQMERLHRMLTEALASDAPPEDDVEGADDGA